MLQHGTTKKRYSEKSEGCPLQGGLTVALDQRQMYFPDAAMRRTIGTWPNRDSRAHTLQIGVTLIIIIIIIIQFLILVRRISNQLQIQYKVSTRNK
jgi:hypothetical protein